MTLRGVQLEYTFTTRLENINCLKFRSPHSSEAFHFDISLNMSGCLASWQKGNALFFFFFSLYPAAPCRTVCNKCVFKFCV